MTVWTGAQERSLQKPRGATLVGSGLYRGPATERARQDSNL